jgi:hypothetical protein
MENKGNGDYPNSSVQIYDRYGKLIIEIKLLIIVGMEK